MRVLLLALLVVGCSDPFRPQSKVDGPRVLGIVADPPEAEFEGTTSLTAIIAYPEKVTHVTWSACPLSLGAEMQYACATPEIPISEGSNSIVFSATILRPWLDALKPMFADFIGFYRQIVNQKDYCMREVISKWDECIRGGGPCEDEGFEMALKCLRANGLKVVFHIAVTLDNGAVMHAYRSVRFRDPTSERPLNNIPRLTGVVIGDRLLKGGETIELEPRKETNVLPLFAENSVETYLNEDGETENERLWVSWFATAGDFAYARCTPEFPEQRYTLPGLGEPEQEAVIWVFVYDDRLGVSYITFKARPSGYKPAKEVSDMEP